MMSEDSRVLPKTDSPKKESWYQWTPATAVDPHCVHLVDAIAGFEPIDTPAGHAAAAWLKKDALEHHGPVVTYVLMTDGAMQGFYAITGSQVRLAQPERREGALAPREVSSMLPASLVTHIARHQDSESGVGRRLLLHAIGTAIKVSELQGNIALLLDAYDSAEAEMLSLNYGFQRGFEDTDRQVVRLWLPILTPIES